MLIETIDIRKEYKMGETSVMAVDGISLKVKRSEFIAIMGPSGSGKSTLLHLLACLDVPTSGSYILNGKEVAGIDHDSLSEIRNHEIGIIFQSFFLIPNQNALQNIELPLIYSGIPTKKRREMAEKALNQVGMERFASFRPNQLSGGQRQRVAIARALIQSPSLILADEPTGNLDSATSHEIMEILVELNRQGNTIILVTHENDIAGFAKRQIRLIDGRILSDAN